MMTHRPCPSCQSREGGRLLIDLPLRTADGHPLQGGYPVRCCERCGTGFADRIVPSGYYDDYYASLAKYAGESTVYERDVADERPLPAIEDPLWLNGKADDSARRIDAVLSDKDARILDIGCSTGGILAALGRLGYRHLTGVDPSADSVRLANTRPGLRVMVGTFAALPAGLGTYDCICITGVLEHLWEPDAAIEACLPLLSPGGVIYIEVPDAGRYLDPYVSPFEDFSTEHINHLSFPGLRRLAARCGLKTVQEISYLAPLTGAVLTGCAAVVWQVGEQDARPVARDDTLEATLVAFTERSARHFLQIEQALEDQLGSCGEYVIWGIGEATFKLLALAGLRSRRAVAYVDNNPARRGFRFDDMAVVAPSEIPPGDVPIIAGSLIRADSIIAAAQALALPNPLVRLDQWHSVGAIA